MLGNAAIVRRGYEAFNGRDLRAFAELLAELVSWYTPGRSPLAGDVVGRDAVVARLGRYSVETGGTFRAEPKRVLTDEDDRVIGIQRNTAERAGKTLDVYSCVIFELEAGLIVDGHEHVYDLPAWDAFWS